jgi:hypothetical protein
MLIVLPVSKSDINLVPKLAEVFGHLGGLSNVEALVVSIEENQDMISEYANLISKVFGKVSTLRISGNCPTGWPRACNYYFTHTARHIEFERGQTEPWYYFEADTVPLKVGWYDALLTEYNLSGKPFMGVKQETYRRNIQTNEIVVDGHHMVGTGIYPAKMSRHSVLYKYVEDQPWDVFCQWEIAPQMRATNKIQHNWSTVKYRKGYSGSIICDDREANIGGITHNKPLRPDALLLHGVKDSSLADLVLADFAVEQPKKK